MSDASPSKRRKTKGAFTMKSKKISWPPGELPVELFTLIISHLPRSNIQNLRLVNKEFDHKISEVLFRVVVVPFRPEIYGITPEATLSNDILQGSIMLQDKGMRVFQGFGRWITRFAMSFEIDQNKLANPPRKSDQEAITSFWGIYRWPFKTYNRYSQLEGLEQTADETRTMAKALKFIIKAKELGLSIDGGLGWLAGPDTNQRVVDRGERPAVFGASRFVPEPKPRQLRQAKAYQGSGAILDSQSGNLYSSLERMLQEAGYRGENLEPSVQMMLETEDLGGQTVTTNTPWDSFVSTTPSLESWRRPLLRRDSFNNSSEIYDAAVGAPSPRNPILTDGEEENEGQDIQATATLSPKLNKAKVEGYPLKPNDLTNAQREMLLEMEWAQNAFMQSWAIAIMDNHKTFQHIQTLNIARLPNRHLPILRREDFWDSLPGLNKFSLAIIPDWREVRKEATSWVQDNRIPPSQSVLGVYEMLNQQISRRKNIKTLHFEWLCGGEYAPGLFARNQQILAAPVVSQAMHMVNRAQQHPVLDLPHIEHLSLKNCWISPHILSRFLMPLRQGVLQSVAFDSVSLTANVAPHAQPNPLTQAAIAQNAQNLAGHAAANNLMFNFQGLVPVQNAQNAPNIQPQPPPVPVPNNANDEPDWLQPPRNGSWAEAIDHLTPGTTLADIRYMRETGPEPAPRTPTSLSRLEFTSCGYLRVPLDFDQTVLDPPQAAAPQNGGITKRINDIDAHMMKPGDPMLGVIVNHISAVEAATLDNAWNMNIGWRLSRPELAADAQLDGFANAGQGRFDGLIEVTRLPSSNRSTS